MTLDPLSSEFGSALEEVFLIQVEREIQASLEAGVPAVYWEADGAEVVITPKER